MHYTRYLVMLLPQLLSLLSLIVSSYLVVVCGQSYYGNALFDALEFWRRGQYYLDLEAIDDQRERLNTYDFIVIGAGTAGCAIAARLSENPQWKVLLIEAGGPENYVMDVPIVAQFLQLGEMNWKYQTQPSSAYCLAMKNNRCNWPRGKVIGGSSVLNYMMYTRGSRKDYDRWAQLGNPGWSYDDLMPYYRKLEGSTIPDADADYVGRNGPVKISYSFPRTKNADAFVKASEQAGLPQGDYNGRHHLSVSYLQANVFNETRWSSNRAYLYPIKTTRHNLHIWKRTLATRILIDPQTRQAKGVAILLPGSNRTTQVWARREVIVSAGAINTPQLLMLSGIGPAKHLREMGIKPLANLAVGYNLQDHIAPAVHIVSNVSVLSTSTALTVDSLGDLFRGRGDLRIPGGVEAISFYALDDPRNKDGWADLEIFLATGAMHTNPALRRAFGIRPDIYEAMFSEAEQTNANLFMLFPMILRAKSRGRIKLKSKNPLHHPLIYANYFANPYDLDIAVRGIQQILELLEQPAMKQINAKVLSKLMPACRHLGAMTKAYWICYARHFTFTIYHYAGTAKMGPKSDPSAVVDHRLRVHGIDNLRVADASIMPYLVSGHPNGPVYLIAEKAADMIKQDHNYS